MKLGLTSGGFATISDEDEPLAAYKWYFHNGYVRRTVDALQLHRAVLHAPAGTIVDHINGDTLDNTRENLRLVSARENARNIAEAQRNSFAGAIGVGWHAQRRKWQASIRVDGKLHHLGLFSDVEEAKRARAEAETRLWGLNPRRVPALAAALDGTGGAQESDGSV